MPSGPAVEASLFALKALSEHFFGEDHTHDDALNELFSSNLFGSLPLEPSDMLSKIQRERLDLLRQCAGFFANHPEFLPALMNMLFSALGNQHLAVEASMVINSIGSFCAEQLVPEVRTYMDNYWTLIESHSMPTEVKTNVMAAISSIVSKTSATRISAIEFLLECTYSDFRAGMRIAAEDPVEGRSLIADSLKCLISMGQALQTCGGGDHIDDHHWRSGEGQALQKNLVETVSLATRILYHDQEVIEAACQIFRAGDKVTRPGLFVFPAILTEDLVRSVTIKTGK